MFTKPLTWIVFVISALISIVITYKFVAISTPLIDINIKANSDDCKQTSLILAQTYNLGPVHKLLNSSDIQYQSFVFFDHDSEAQTFIDLDYGKDALIKSIQLGYVVPYVWKVRHFKEYEANVVTFVFKPDGTPYGFVESVADNQLTPSINDTEAYIIAQSTAGKWNVDLSNYKLITKSSETKSNKRTDHTLIFSLPERDSSHIQSEAVSDIYRLQIVITGDKVTTLKHFVEIPQDFQHRYALMRASNNNITLVSMLSMYILYLIGGGIGLYFLSSVRWKMSIYVSGALCILLFIEEINGFSSVWKHYNTSTSLSGHTIINLLLKVVICGTTMFLCCISISYAENLTQQAFGHHLQLSRLSSLSVLNTKETTAKFIGGYLMSIIFLGMSSVFCFTTTNYFGWWSESTIVTNPNILSTSIPWLNPLVISMQAGIMEECLYRAVPIAGAILIGRWCNRERTWIVIGFVIQTLIFGGVHASYSAQPSYSRVVELIGFSVIQGIIYMKYGLVPVVVTHFSYDVILLSIPLFASGLWMSQIMIIVVALSPLIIIGIVHFHVGSWEELKSDDFNCALSGTVPKTIEIMKPKGNDAKTTEKVSSGSDHQPAFFYKSMIVLGVLSCVGIYCLIPLGCDCPPITMSRTDALETTRQKLFLDGMNITDEWSLTSVNHPSDNFEYQFVWQKSPEVYRQLIHSYLIVGEWTTVSIPFTNLENDTSKKYVVALNGDNITYFYYEFPETMSGARLNQSEARMIATQKLRNFSLNTFEEIFVKGTNHSQRYDWNFRFVDTNVSKLLGNSRACVSISISGNKISAFKPYIDLPEEIVRDNKNKLVTIQIISGLSTIFSAITFSIVIIKLFRDLSSKNRLMESDRKSRHCFMCDSKKWMLIAFLIIMGCIRAFNNIVSHIPTQSESYMGQYVKNIGVSILGCILSALVIGFLTNIITMVPTYSNNVSKNLVISVGMSIGLLRFFLDLITNKIVADIGPSASHYEELNSYISWLAGLDKTNVIFINTVIVTYMYMLLISYLTNNLQKRNIYVYAMIVILLSITNMFSQNECTKQHINYWIFTSFVTAIYYIILYYSIISINMSIIPVVSATVVIMNCIQQMILNTYSGAILNKLITITGVVITAWIWNILFTKTNTVTSEHID